MDASKIKVEFEDEFKSSKILNSIDRIEDKDDDRVEKISNSSDLVILKSQCVKKSLFCCKCQCQIELNDRYFNLPSLTNCERRKVWCERLEFSYMKTVQKERTWNAKPICYKHFREADLLEYPTKSKIERLALPEHNGIRKSIASSQMTSRMWVCTLCRFRSYSVHNLYTHVKSVHLAALLDVQPPINGYMCPFCRRCSYGYRTIGGFIKHLDCPPCTHFLLNKVFESASSHDRDYFLSPSYVWETWTEKNIALALFGSLARPASSCKFGKVDKDQSDNRRNPSDPPTATVILRESDPISFEVLSRNSEHDDDKSCLEGVKTEFGVKYGQMKKVIRIAMDEDSVGLNNIATPSSADKDPRENMPILIPKVARNVFSILHAASREMDRDNEDIESRPSFEGQLMRDNLIYRSLVSKRTTRQLESTQNRLRFFGPITNEERQPILNLNRHELSIDDQLGSGNSKMPLDDYFDTKHASSQKKPVSAHKVAISRRINRLILKGRALDMECNICSICFFSHQALKKHIVKVHSNKMQE